MKKLFFMLIAASGALSAFAQAPATPNADSIALAKRMNSHADSLLPKWVIDVNFMGGVLTQDMTFEDPAANYNNILSNARFGTQKFSNGVSLGGSAQVGYFFDRAAHFGVGLGLMYLNQKGDLTTSDYHVEYQSNDFAGNTYRQVITANNKITEKLDITNINIPLVFKYKLRFAKHWGITADAGLLFNVKMANHYSSDATFDYEAIYKLVGPNTDPVAVYDYLINPSSSDWMITKSAIGEHGGNVAQEFADLHAQGYNVGLNEKPNTGRTGTISYATGSLGFIVQPSLNYFFSDKVALNVGGYFMYQPFTHSANSKKMTDKIGQYNSMLNGVSSTNNQSYGAHIGVRFFFGKPKDTDHDGIPDKKDLCPNEFGLAQFNGCPDRDGDGIPDSKDSCIDVVGTIRFHGCPDADNDGIPDKDDACPYNPGSPKNHGCPDTDMDGLPDNEDKCPTVFGPASNHGCPVDTPKAAAPAPAPKPKAIRDISEPILFELGKAKVKEESLPVLVQAIMELNNDDNAFVIIDGHTDVVGSDKANEALSFKRANAVRKYLIDMGGNPKRMISVGHGSRQPVAPNTSPDNRARNRRVIMGLRH